MGWNQLGCITSGVVSVGLHNKLESVGLHNELGCITSGVVSVGFNNEWGGISWVA